VAAPAYRAIWFIDTEFTAVAGERPRPLCICGQELHSGATFRWWLQGQPDTGPPFAVGPDVLVVAFQAWAEWAVYLVMGWPLPVRVLDLGAEYKWMVSGLRKKETGQLDALEAFGLPAGNRLFKYEMQDFCAGGGPYTYADEAAILDYCESDVNGLAALYEAMSPRIEWPQALARGRYTVAVARVQDLGVPIDTDLHGRLLRNRAAIRRVLVRDASNVYGVDENGELDQVLFGEYLAREGIPWKYTPKTGQLATDRETFEDAVDDYPQMQPLYELRSALGRLKDDGGLTVGADGRNRTELWPFSTSSGRNAPSTTKFVFGKAKAFRHLIRAAPGWAVAAVDWKAQEVLIAAALSGDANMLAAYRADDVYMAFARQAKAVPDTATAESHPAVRALFKTAMLATNYSQGAESLARRLRLSRAHAVELLSLHKNIYRRYWRWIESVQDQAFLTGRLETCFGWQVNVGPNTKWRSVRNYPMQSTGAEMMRLALCLATERGVRVVAPVHDAFLVEGPSVAGIDTAVRDLRRAMDEASAAVLGGHVADTDVKVFRHPNRYADRRATGFWLKLLAALARVEAANPVHFDRGDPVHFERAPRSK
jgi:hypothetical protein